MIYFEKEQCVNCGLCIRNCCMGVLVPGEETPQVHPKRRCIQCMHCASGCPRKAIRFSEIPELYQEFPQKKLKRLLMQRRSIRHFKEQLPDRGVLEDALKTAFYAPSGKNQKAYRITVVWGKAQVAALRDRCLSLCCEYGEAPELPKLMEKGTDLLTCGAPCMIVVHSPEDCLNPVLDPAVYLVELELLLVEAGLGTCWGGYLRQVSDRFPEIRQWLRVPEGSRVRCALMVGYADREKYPNAVWHPEVPVTFLEEGKD